MVVVDVNYNFVGDKPEPILDSIKRWRNSCGEEGWQSVAVIRKLLRSARAKGIPVLYTTGDDLRPDRFDAGAWAWKNGRSYEAYQHEKDGNAIVDEITPSPKDLLIKKMKPSGFFGTCMLSYLVDLEVDSLFVTGTTTSGCVRATVIDAFSYNFRVSVIEDGCFDRSQASHAINLCDMNAKYADVVDSNEVLDFIDSLPEGLFELPQGQLIEMAMT
nr:isochorismatase family protein [Thermostichus vulcanus]